METTSCNISIKRYRSVYKFLFSSTIRCEPLKGLVVYSDNYKCSVIFHWKKGSLEILGISYEKDGISIEDILKDISELSGVPVSEIRRLLRRLMRRTGYYTTSLRDLKDFIKQVDTIKREELIVSRVALVSSIA